MRNTHIHSNILDTCHESGIVAKVGRWQDEPHSPLYSGHAFDLGGAECIEAVHECYADLDLIRGCGRFGQDRQLQRAGDRRVADAIFLTALPDDADLSACFGKHGHRTVVVDLNRAEIRISLLLPGEGLNLERHALRRFSPDVIAVEVIARLNLPADLDTTPAVSRISIRNACSGFIG